MSQNTLDPKKNEINIINLWEWQKNLYMISLQKNL